MQQPGVQLELAPLISGVEPPFLQLFSGGFWPIFALYTGGNLQAFLLRVQRIRRFRIFPMVGDRLRMSSVVYSGRSSRGMLPGTASTNCDGT
jgi:hypothetical protein